MTVRNVCGVARKHIFDKNLLQVLGFKDPENPFWLCPCLSWFVCCCIRLRRPFRDVVILFIQCDINRWTLTSHSALFWRCTKVHHGLLLLAHRNTRAEELHTCNMWTVFFQPYWCGMTAFCCCDAVMADVPLITTQAVCRSDVIRSTYSQGVLPACSSITHMQAWIQDWVFCDQGEDLPSSDRERFDGACKLRKRLWKYDFFLVSKQQWSLENYKTA